MVVVPRIWITEVSLVHNCMEEDGQFSKHMDAFLGGGGGDDGGGAIAYLEAMAEYLGLTDGKHTAAVICSFL
jgi:hypothetical protein